MISFRNWVKCPRQKQKQAWNKKPFLRRAAIINSMKISGLHYQNYEHQLRAPNFQTGLTCCQWWPSDRPGLSHWFQISAGRVEVSDHNSACFTIMLLLMLTRNENYNPEIVKWIIKNKSRVKMKGKVQRMMWKKKLALASCVPWVLCDTCTTLPLSSCT